MDQIKIKLKTPNGTKDYVSLNVDDFTYHRNFTYENLKQYDSKLKEHIKVKVFKLCTE